MSVWRSEGFTPYWALWNDLDPPASRTLIVFDNDKTKWIDHWDSSGSGYDPLRSGSEIFRVEDYSAVPFRSFCAECSIGIYELDYLCSSCRRTP